MYRRVEIPYGCYWSTPFVRWQGSLAHLHSLHLAAHVARGELERRHIPVTAFDQAVLGMTTPQAYSFHGLPWLLSLLAAKELGGPTVSQACATGTRCVNIAADEIELGRAGVSLVVTCDRTSNGPLVTYLDSNGPGGGRPDDEHWILDSFFGKTPVPFANEPIVNTAENCANHFQIGTEEQHALVLRRYEQYRAALADDRAFLKRFMTLPFAVPDKNFAKNVKTIDGDEGVHDTDREKLAKLKPVSPGGTVTYAGQTHPADGNAAIIVAGRERAAELSRDPNIRIEVLGVGQAARGGKDDAAGAGARDQGGARRRRRFDRPDRRGEVAQPVHCERHRVRQEDRRRREHNQQFRLLARLGSPACANGDARHHRADRGIGDARRRLWPVPGLRHRRLRHGAGAARLRRAEALALHVTHRGFGIA